MALLLLFIPLGVLSLSLSLLCAHTHAQASNDMYLPFTPTGRVQEYTLVITRDTPPDKKRAQVMVNGSSPGPPLYVNLGDTLRVTVINELYDDATGVHWHGMSMDDEPWMDGVIDLTQCPISNVQGFNKMVYQFTPHSTGTHWYHGHYHSQSADGLFGALIVRSNREPALHDKYGSGYAIDNANFVYIMADYYLDDVRKITDWFLSSLDIDVAGRDPVADSFTVNGKFPFEDNQRFNPNFDGKEHTKSITRNPNVYKTRWRFINAGAFAPYTVRMDNVIFEIIELDGIPIKPLFVEEFSIFVSQRMSVIPHFLSFRDACYLHIEMQVEHYPQYNTDLPNNNIIGLISKQPVNTLWKQRIVFDFDTASARTPSRQQFTLTTLSSKNIFEGEPIVYSETPLVVPEPTHVLLMKTTFIYHQTNTNLRDSVSKGIVTGYINGDTYPMRMSSSQHNNFSPLAPIIPVLYDYLNRTRAEESFTSFFSVTSSTSLKFKKSSSFLTVPQTLQADYLLPYRVVSGINPNHERYEPGVVRYIDGSGNKPYELPHNAVVDMIIDGQCCGSHPFHMHGHHFYLIDSSAFHTGEQGTDDYFYADSNPLQQEQGFDRETKPIRDVAVLPPGGWIRIRIVADNPGVWMFHCHLHWHMEIGLSAVLLEAPLQIRAKYRQTAVPRDHLAMCAAPTAVKSATQAISSFSSRRHDRNFANAEASTSSFALSLPRNHRKRFRGSTDDDDNE